MRSEAEIQEKLKSLRKQFAESEKNPTQTTQNRRDENYLVLSEKRRKQCKDEIDWIGEIAILEWVLEEKQHWLPTWMRVRE
jgi:hypothetical protein